MATDVHTEHCCIAHGCKYGHDKCTVMTKKKPQSGYCETCYFAAERLTVRGVMGASIYDMLITICARIDIMHPDQLLPLAVACERAAGESSDPTATDWLHMTAMFIKEKARQ
jgi:hypothetical protein